MSFVSNPIHGQWWKETDGTEMLENNVNVERKARRLRVRRSLEYLFRTYRNRTDGTDGQALDPDSMELWDDPMEGEPSSAEDWLVKEASIEYDMETGLVEISVGVVKIPLDWQSSDVVSRREYL